MERSESRIARIIFERPFNPVVEIWKPHSYPVNRDVRNAFVPIFSPFLSSLFCPLPLRPFVFVLVPRRVPRCERVARTDNENETANLFSRTGLPKVSRYRAGTFHRLITTNRRLFARRNLSSRRDATRRRDTTSASAGRQSIPMRYRPI